MNKPLKTMREFGKVAGSKINIKTDSLHMFLEQPARRWMEEKNPTDGRNEKAKLSQHKKNKHYGKL